MTLDGVDRPAERTDRWRTGGAVVVATVAHVDGGLEHVEHGEREKKSGGEGEPQYQLELQRHSGDLHNDVFDLTRQNRRTNSQRASTLSTIIELFVFKHNFTIKVMVAQTKSNKVDLL